MYSLWQGGSSLTELADEFKLTPQRCGQVIASYHPEDDENVDRSLYRGYLWRLFEEIRELYRHPGYKMSPNGGTAHDPDGDPALDTNVRLQAGELELKILESLRKLDARDRPQAKHLQVTHELADQQKNAALAEARARMELSAADRRELEALRQRAGQVIPGEVVRELEPVQQRGDTGS